MCEPSLIVGGLSAVATLASAQQQNSAANQQAKEAKRASQAEALRQQEFADRKMALVSAEEQNGYTPDQREAQLASAAAARESSFEPATAGIGTMPVYNDSAPEVVKSDLANAMLNALKRGKDYSKTLATLGAYGDVGQKHATSLGRTAQGIGILNGYSQDSMGLLNNELASAQRAGQGAANNAGILGGLGALGSVYAGKLYGGSGGLGSSGIGGISGSSTF